MDSRVVNLRDFWVKGQHMRGGYILPKDVVRVDRKSKWGNPFKIGDAHPTGGYPMTRAVVVHEYAKYLDQRLSEDPNWIEPLRGKRLCCWCAPDLCHAEVILERLDATERQSAPA